MDRSYRWRIYRGAAFGLVLMGLGVAGFMRGTSTLLSALCIVIGMAYLGILGMGIATSRCPRCGAFVDLRRPGIQCPKCGVWLGSSEESKEESVVEQDELVQFESQLGNSFIAPSQWTSTDKGDTLSLRSPDGQAVIHAIMFTSEGSGSIEAFREMLAASLLPQGATGWEESEWTMMEMIEGDAHRRELASVPESDERWRLYVLDRGRFYYGIILSASEVAMELNGGFYENIVRTFRGVRL